MGARWDEESNKAMDEVHLADAVHRQVYVCFKGPLEVHQKTDVSEKIWKDEYIFFFSCC